jgi:hypothetical protein
MDGVDYNPSVRSCGVFYTDSSTVNDTNAVYFENFIDSLKTRGQVEQVGVIVYNSSTDSDSYSVEDFNVANISQAVHMTNYSLPWTKKIDVLSLDDEYWLDNYATSLKEFHSVHMPMLKAMWAAAHECDTGYLRVEDYIRTPLVPDTATTNKSQAMELDSIGLYTDRVLLSSYTAYPTALWTRADWIQGDSELGLNRFHAYYKKEIWPVFESANACGSCTICYDASCGNGGNGLGDSLCGSKHANKAEYMENDYFDSLSYSENHTPTKVFANSINGSFYETPMGADTNFQILGCMWYHYGCLKNEGLSFDTVTSGSSRGYLPYYVTVGPDIQYINQGVYLNPPITITATVHGGKEPYTYTWYDVQTGNTLNYSTSGNTYTTYWSPSLSRYSVKELGVVVRDAGDTNVTDYLYIYQYCVEPNYPNNHHRVKNNHYNTDGTNSTGEMEVYPNPNQGSFTLNLENTMGNSQIIIYNMLGEKVYSQFTIGNSQFTINLHNQSAGMYFYRVVSESGSLIGDGKLIVQK